LLPFRGGSSSYLSVRFRACTSNAAPLRRYAFTLGFVLIFPLSIKLGQGLSERLPEQTKRIADIVGDRLNGACAADWMETEPRLTSDCVHDVDGRPSIALLGDGHAWALSPGIRQLAASENMGFRIYTKPGCPTLVGVSVARAAQPLATESCATFNLNVIRRTEADKSVKLVILAALCDNPVKSYVEHPSNVQPSMVLSYCGLALNDQLKS
jgi:hypothetical protein